MTINFTYHDKLIMTKFLKTIQLRKMSITVYVFPLSTTRGAAEIELDVTSLGADSRMVLSSRVSTNPSAGGVMLFTLAILLRILKDSLLRPFDKSHLTDS